MQYWACFTKVLLAWQLILSFFVFNQDGVSKSFENLTG